MTQQPPPAGQEDHWADRLAEKVSREWPRHHRLRWALLRLREQLQGPQRETLLAPGEGRCPGLPEPELDAGESAAIRLAWRRHVARTRARTIAERIGRAQEEQQRRRERWIRDGISREDLEQLRHQAAADEQMRRHLQRLMRLAMWLLPSCSSTREMQACWLMAPSTPPVLLSVGDATPPDEDGPGFHGHYFPLSVVSIWRQEPSGGRTLLSATTMHTTEAAGLWGRRRRLGWRLVPPPC